MKKRIKCLTSVYQISKGMGCKNTGGAWTSNNQMHRNTGGMNELQSSRREKIYCELY